MDVPFIWAYKSLSSLVVELLSLAIQTGNLTFTCGACLYKCVYHIMVDWQHFHFPLYSTSCNLSCHVKWPVFASSLSAVFVFFFWYNYPLFDLLYQLFCKEKWVFLLQYEVSQHFCTYRCVREIQLMAVQSFGEHQGSLKLYLSLDAAYQTGIYFLY